MRIVTFSKLEEMHVGLTGMKPIPADTIYVFPGITWGATFHSKGVLEDFELAFLNTRGEVLLFARLHPEDARIIAPPGTAMAVEGAVGTISGLGFGKLAELVRA